MSFARLCFHAAAAACCRGDELNLPPSPPPVLSAHEKAEGWTLVFDGSTWANLSLSKVPETNWWSVENGWIRSHPQGQGTGRRLYTLETYENFELQFDWRIAPEGNSGVKYRIQRVWIPPSNAGRDEITASTLLERPTPANLQNGTAIGFEYQMADDESTPDALGTRLKASAALYGVIAPRMGPPARAHVEHHSRIRVDGWHFEHWLDGRKMAEGDLTSALVRSRLRANRSRAKEQFARTTGSQERYNARLEEITADRLLAADVGSSPIDFQHHRSGVAFRNIKIRRLP